MCYFYPLPPKQKTKNKTKERKIHPLFYLKKTRNLVNSFKSVNTYCPVLVVIDVIS